MIESESKVRVRYAETDKMGYVYYGRYLEYYEIGRTDLIRNLGITYRELEEKGIFLPVYQVNINYHKAAKYDEVLTIKTYLKSLPAVRIKFDYEIFNESNELINTGDVTLLFIDEKSRKPLKAPSELINIFSKYFKKH